MYQRLNEIVERRAAAEARLMALETEGAMEAAFSADDAAAGLYRVGYLEGLKLRKARVQASIDELLVEEQGARDSLAEAFESQKKYEQVAETAMILERKEAGRREAAVFDEMALRKAAR